MTKPVRPKRLRRCQLSVPGSSEKMIAKAATLDLDYVFFDLEDAVAPDQKKAARANIVKALNTMTFGRTVRCVRINDTATRFCYGDIIDVVEGAGENLDLIMIPKVLDADDVLFVDKLLFQLEKDLGLKNRIGLECLIEEVEGMMNIERIAASTPRLEALIFGMGDYSASQGVSVKAIGSANGYPGDIWHYQRHRLAIACKSFGLDPVDGPYADIQNPDGYREECRRAMALGLVGKWALHPSQVFISQEVFSPTQGEVDKARAMKAAFDEALSKGLGAVMYEGKMIDIASIRIVNNVVDRANLIGM
ncbi:HpcH/HpaI aldolase/citrate lyase family protein [Bradyrhizobium stylosanthis]|uniref:Citrate lyase subunit beta/citryl-CoA lyase n=1 Tax=Bradyrhizobium stylosanthis TaxID=1803665 RepID=A0A560D6A9_9BRAD|nr:CoA ester lyase [Bradyrhizobium stylosanthis]TWA92623.1 citrate lyase subunit beta/citryl-CoA lyase [Bradyrhizobium stylosanthis]